MMHATVSHKDELTRAVETMDLTVHALTFHYIRAALAAQDGNISATARRLGMHRRTLQRMLAQTCPVGRIDR